MGSDIVIAGAARTPIGVLGGFLKHWTNQKLGASLVRGMLNRVSFPWETVDEVIFGCVAQHSDAPNVARVISLSAGLPSGNTACTVGRNCASGMQALVSAYQAVALGDAHLVLAGGIEVMSSAPYVNRDLRFGRKLRHSMMIDSLWEGLTDPVSGLLMGETAESLSREFKISRRSQDEYALFSHRKSVKARAQGEFKDEILPITVKTKTKKSGAETSKNLEDDEGPNPELTLEKLAEYPPAFGDGGTVTAGNSCPISDGAAAMWITSRKKASAVGLESMGSIRGYAFSGIEPERMGLGPVMAIDMALKRAKVNLTDIDLIEMNEAFAAQYLAVEETMRWDRNKVNVNGGAIALGHPVGASGARIVVTLLHAMRKRNATLGLAALCVGGGQGAAMVIERP